MLYKNNDSNRSAWGTCQLAGGLESLSTVRRTRCATGSTYEGYAAIISSVEIAMLALDRLRSLSPKGLMHSSHAARLLYATVLKLAFTMAALRAKPDQDLKSRILPWPPRPVGKPPTPDDKRCLTSKLHDGHMFTAGRVGVVVGNALMGI
jgi:hypothetical protein